MVEFPGSVVSVPDYQSVLEGAVFAAVFADCWNLYTVLSEFLCNHSRVYVRPVHRFDDEVHPGCVSQNFPDAGHGGFKPAREMDIFCPVCAVRTGKVSGKMPPFNEEGERLLLEAFVPEIPAEFRHLDPYPQPRRHDHEAEPEGRTQYFTEGPHVDHLFGIHDLQGRDRFSAVAEFAVKVVFDNPASGFAGFRQELYASCRGESSSERKLMVRCYVEVVRSVSRNFLRDDAFFVDRNPGHAGVQAGEYPADKGRLGIFHDDFAGVEEAGEDRKALRGSRCDDDMFRIGGYAFNLPDMGGDRFAEPEASHGRAIAEFPVSGVLQCVMVTG